eukprot:CFRG6701T1
MTTIIKATYNGEVRRFRVTCWDEAQLQICDFFRLNAFTAKYKDDDGDNVTISSDVELSEACECLPKDLVLRISVTDNNSVSRSSTSMVNDPLAHETNMSTTPPAIECIPEALESTGHSGPDVTLPPQVEFSNACCNNPSTQISSPDVFTSMSDDFASSLNCIPVKPASLSHATNKLPDTGPDNDLSRRTNFVAKDTHVVNHDNATGAQNHHVPDPEFHYSVICDVCNNDIVGVRYKCTICDNYDMCEQCQALGHEPIDHPLLMIRTPLTPESRRGLFGPRGSGGLWHRRGNSQHAQEHRHVPNHNSHPHGRRHHRGHGPFNVRDNAYGPPFYWNGTFPPPPPPSPPRDCRGYRRASRAHEWQVFVNRMGDEARRAAANMFGIPVESELSAETNSSSSSSTPTNHENTSGSQDVLSNVYPNAYDNVTMTQEFTDEVRKSGGVVDALACEGETRHIVDKNNGAEEDDIPLNYNDLEAMSKLYELGFTNAKKNAAYIQMYGNDVAVLADRMLPYIQG